MLHVYASGDNAAPTVHDVHSDANVTGYAATGLPDDFNAFMADVLAGEPVITEADIDAMWAEEHTRRDAAAGLWVSFDIGALLEEAIEQAFAGLASPLPAA